MTKSFWYKALLLMSLSCASLSFAASDLSRALNSNVSITGQMTSAKFEQLLKDGFKSVIVNLPD